MGFISLDTLIGIILGFGLFGYSIFISTDNYAMFLSLPSLLMVIGGTIAATMISYQGRYVMIALKEMGSILIHQAINPKTLFADVKRVIGWATIIKSKGISGLEEDLEQNKTDDPYVLYAAELLSTGYKSHQVRQLLTDFMESTFERSLVPANIVTTMATYAPAFGMIGTLVGLIIMLDNLGGDASELGKGLSIALMTTLYGVLFAQLVCKPASLKITQKHEIIRFRNTLLMEGFVLLADKADAIVIQDKMNSFLAPKAHFSVLDDGDN